MTFRVEQGMQSPSNDTIGWRYWEQYPTRKEALRDAKRLAKIGGIWRVLEIHETAVYGLRKKP